METINVDITGGPMQLVVWAPGLEGIYNLSEILTGPAWVLHIGGWGTTCLELLPAGDPLGQGRDNFCHIVGIDSLQPIGQPCPGCFNVTTYNGTQFFASETVSYAELPHYHWTETSVLEPGTPGLLVLGFAVMAFFLTRRRPDIACLR